MLSGIYMVAKAEGKYRALGGHRANDYGPGGNCSICGRKTRYSSQSRNGVAHRSEQRSRSIQPIPAVQDYMKRHHPEYAHRAPIIFEARNEKGWHQYPFRKRVSRSWLRKMRTEGYTWVGLSPSTDGVFVADFSIAELLKGG